MISAVRLLLAWATVAAFLGFGGALLGDLGDPLRSGALFLWLFVTIVWCAFGVVRHADELAELLGEPFGTLILTLSIVVIEVALISAVMLTSDTVPTLGRDTMFAVLMIVLNGVVGLALLLGGLRHHQQAYNLQGATAYLTLIFPLAVISLVLPNFTRSTPDPTLTPFQSVFFALFTLLLYGVFLSVQTVLHRSFFMAPDLADPAEEQERAHGVPVRPGANRVARETLLLLAHALPIVLLAKYLATLLEHGIARVGAPAALGGVLIAAVIFAPEGSSALRAAMGNSLQRAVNLCLGAAGSTIGITVPAVITVGLITGRPVVLGLEAAEMVLLAVTLILSALTFRGPRTTILEGAVHLVLFLVYLVLIFSP